MLHSINHDIGTLLSLADGAPINEKLTLPGKNLVMLRYLPIVRSRLVFCMCTSVGR
jgi:hypothetical protein